jgi:outer membrane protein OmpA-like peptidoglycan-associated protein
MRIYYTGDVANQPGWFKQREIDKFHIELIEEGGNRRRFIVAPQQIGDKYKGHCNPRFVTEAAHEAYYVGQREEHLLRRAILNARAKIIDRVNGKAGIVLFKPDTPLLTHGERLILDAAAELLGQCEYDWEKEFEV